MGYTGVHGDTQRYMGTHKDIQGYSVGYIGIHWNTLV